MNERRNSYPILLPAGKRWKALLGFLGFSGIVTLATLLIGGGAAWNEVKGMRTQLADIQKLAHEVVRLRGRVAELTIALNETRVHVGLQPFVHQSILDGGTAPTRGIPQSHEAIQAILPVVQRRIVR